jgi:hypothetical protein
MQQQSTSGEQNHERQGGYQRPALVDKSVPRGWRMRNVVRSLRPGRRGRRLQRCRTRYEIIAGGNACLTFVEAIAASGMS